MATVKVNYSIVKRVIVHECEHGVYLFPCASLEDGSAMGDDWFPSVADADELGRQKYGITSDDWTYIGDPTEGCMQDWIAPVRLKERHSGHSEWIKLERLENGVWTEFVWRTGF